METNTNAQNVDLLVTLDPDTGAIKKAHIFQKRWRDLPNKYPKQFKRITVTRSPYMSYSDMAKMHLLIIGEPS